jgi:uncharacterized repeat protein (TIGR03803 family)
MKRASHWVFACAAIVWLSHSAPRPLLAAPFTVLHSFGQFEGFGPSSSLTLIGSTLYGTTFAGGGLGNFAGSVFAVDTDGTGFHEVHGFDFNGGRYPRTGVVYDGTSLYGNTSSASSGFGTVYKVKPDGTGFQVIRQFPGVGNDPRVPEGDLVLAGSFLYGTAEVGNGRNGVVYRMATDGTAFTFLHQFSFTGAEGIGPSSGVIHSGGTLYGMTGGGGASNQGAIFSVGALGGSFTLLHSFAGGPSDGSYPLYGGLTQVGSTLYGVTSEGGAANAGTIFKMGIDGSGYQLLHSFLGGADGATPLTSLTLVGSALYGTTRHGGSADKGTIYAINADGTGYQVVHTFLGANGEDPEGTLLLSGSTLYGTTVAGGANNSGTVFAMAVPEPSTIILAITSALGLPLVVPRLRQPKKYVTA